MTRQKVPELQGQKHLLVQTELGPPLPRTLVRVRAGREGRVREGSRPGLAGGSGPPEWGHLCASSGRGSHHHGLYPQSLSPFMCQSRTAGHRSNSSYQMRKWK